MWVCVCFRTSLSPDSGPPLPFPGETRGRCWEQSFLAGFHSYVYYTWILILQLGPSGSGRTAYNLHVTKATYFPIYCVSEERGARCWVSSCWSCGVSCCEKVASGLVKSCINSADNILRVHLEVSFHWQNKGRRYLTFQTDTFVRQPGYFLWGLKIRWKNAWITCGDGVVTS